MYSKCHMSLTMEMYIHPTHDHEISRYHKKCAGNVMCPLSSKINMHEMLSF